MTELSDNRLIEDFLDGDESAFPVLLDRYLKPVYNFLFRFTGDPSSLDDLTQETFIKAWKNLHRFDQNKNFKTWIFTIARNTAYDHFKKKKALLFSSFTDEEGYNKLEEIDEDSLLPDELLEKEESAGEFEKKLTQLPEPYRLVLMMRYKDDLSLREIAEILKESYNTIKSRHNRALLKLREILEKS